MMPTYYVELLDLAGEWFAYAATGTEHAAAVIAASLRADHYADHVRVTTA